MNELTTADFIRMFDTIAVAIEADRDRLSELDGVIGDADHGVTMNIGFSAVTKALASLDLATSDPALVFNTAAKTFLNAVGASTGPLYGTAFMRAGAALKGKTSVGRDEVVAVIVAMTKGMQDRGKADRGDKTMMDAWLPAAEAAEETAAGGGSLSACLQAAVKAAAEGAEATKAMIASKGRASRLGERALGHMDPGAASAVVILDAMAASLA